MIAAIEECQTSRTTWNFKLREPQTSKTWKLLNWYLPDLQSLHHECILLQEKLFVDAKKDLKASESKLLQFSSMVSGVIDQINRYNSSTGSLDLRQMQFLELTISSKILPVRASLLNQLQEAQLVEKFQQEAKNKMGHWTILTFDSSSDSIHSQFGNELTFLQDTPSKLMSTENQSIQPNAFEQIDCTMTINPHLKHGEKSTSVSSPSQRPSRSKKWGDPTGDDLNPQNNLSMAEVKFAYEVELDQANADSSHGIPLFDAHSHCGYEEGRFNGRVDAYTEFVLLDEMSPSSDGENDFENDFENEGLASQSPTTGDDFMSTETCSDDGIDFDWLNPNFPILSFDGGGDEHLADVTDIESLNAGLPALPALSLSTDSCSSRSSSSSSSSSSTGYIKRKRKWKSTSADSDTPATLTGQGGPDTFSKMVHSSEPEPSPPSTTMACPPSTKMNKVCTQTGRSIHKHGHECTFARGQKRRSNIMSYPRTSLQAEYLCSVCKERYQCTVNENPWWAVLHQECPHCNAVQVPRIDIHAASNAIESNPNFFTLYWEGADDKDNDDFDNVTGGREDEEASHDLIDFLAADQAPKRSYFDLDFRPSDLDFHRPSCTPIRP